MKTDRAILFLGRTLWLRQTEGWRHAPVPGPDGADAGLSEALKKRSATCPVALVFEPEGLSHARAAGHFDSRDQFRESLRNRQRFPALGRDDLAWAFEVERLDSRQSECHVHCESVPELQMFRETLEQAGVGMSGAWSLWSVLRASTASGRPGQVVVVLSSDFLAVASVGRGNLGPFFRTWAGRRNEASARSIATVVGELNRTQAMEGETAGFHVRVYGEEWDAEESLLKEISKGATLEKLGFDQLIESTDPRELPATADLFRSFPRIVRLDRPILRAAIAAGFLFAGITAVATAKEHRSMVVFNNVDLAQHRQMDEIMHRTENQRLIAAISDVPDSPRSSLIACVAKLAPALPQPVYLTEVTVEKTGRFHLRGRVMKPGIPSDGVGTALKAAGWTCNTMELAADGISWSASGELWGSNHGA